MSHERLLEFEAELMKLGRGTVPPPAPPAAPAALDPRPLGPGDVVNVYVDPWTRVKREGIAVLIRPRAMLVPRPPLEAWDVRLDTCENDAGELLRVPRSISHVWRCVQPIDRLAIAADVAASSPAGGGQLRLLEDEAERARR